MDQLRSTRSGLLASGKPVYVSNGSGRGTPADTPGLQHVTDSLPFEPLYQFQRTNAFGQRPWMFWCPKIGRDGRCTIYAERPALCVAYAPKQDGLCAEYETPMQQLGAELLKEREKADYSPPAETGDGTR